MDLTFQVPMQYCSLQHLTLPLSPVTSTTGYCFCFGSISSFFLELFLHWFPVTYWVPPDLGSSSFNVLSFSLFILFMGFSRQEYWSVLLFPSLVDHILSELSTVTHPSWVALHGMTHSFIELDKTVVHVIRLVNFLWLRFQSFCPLMPSLSTYHLTWASLTLDVGYLFTAAPAKHSHCPLPWIGVSPHSCRYWPWTWGISSVTHLSSAAQLLLAFFEFIGLHRSHSWKFSYWVKRYAMCVYVCVHLHFCVCVCRYMYICLVTTSLKVTYVFSKMLFCNNWTKYILSLQSI